MRIAERVLLEELYKEEYKAAEKATQAALAQGFAVDTEKTKIDMTKRASNLPKDLQVAREVRLDQLRQSMFKREEDEESDSSESDSDDDSEASLTRRKSTRV